MCNDPLDPNFWWNNHERLVCEGRLDEPFRRNPNDIREALSMTPEARQPAMDAILAAERFIDIGSQSVAETAMYTFVARLMDAGILVRPTKEEPCVVTR
jgi:hypothetical protein